MAGSESQLKKMVSKVRLRRALLSAHTHHSPPRRQGLPAQPNEPPPGGLEAPGFPRPPLPPPAPGCLSPGAGVPGPEPAGGGDGQQWSGAEAACHLPPALLFSGRESLERSVGQHSFHQHKEGVVLKTRSWAPPPLLSQCRALHSLFALPSRLPEVVSFSVCILHAAQ